jgi:hypothetical protein
MQRLYCGLPKLAVAIANPVELAFAYGVAGAVIPEKDYSQYSPQSSSKTGTYYHDHST